MLTLPNIISLFRIPLAILFVMGTLKIRATALILALLSDGMDGLFARRYSQVTKLGTFLDPLTDKMFVMVALSLFLSEGRLTSFEVTCFLCRDISVLLFGIYLIIAGHFTRYQFRAIWCGKVTTFLQFAVLLGLTFSLPIPSALYTIFLMLGVLALFELYFVEHAPNT